MDIQLSATERMALAEDDETTVSALRELVHGEDPAPFDNEPDLESAAALNLMNSCRDPRTIEGEIILARDASKELESGYLEGDLDLSHREYSDKLRALRDREADLLAELSESRVITQMSEAAQSKEWFRQIEQVKRQAKREGVDLSDPQLAEQWDRNVKYLGSMSENGDKPMSWFLTEALAMVRVRLEDTRQKKQRTARHEDHGSGFSQHSGGDRLSQLKGFELEAALARMTPEQAEAWLNS
jgi:hypothetical protein